MAFARFAGPLARGAAFLCAATAIAGCGVETGTARSGDTRAHFTDGTPIPSPGDTTIVMEHRDGRMRAIVGASDGRSMMIVGPDSGTGSLGFIYRFSDLHGVPSEWKPKEYAVVTNVDPRSAAGQAGLRRGDVLLAVNGKDGLDPWLLRDRTPGTVYQLRVRRGPERHDIRAVVGPAPSREQIEWDLRRQASCVRQAADVAEGLGAGESPTVCLMPY